MANYHSSTPNPCNPKTPTNPPSHNQSQYSNPNPLFVSLPKLKYSSVPSHRNKKKMAATMATASTVAGLGASTLSSPRKLKLSSGFLKAPVAARNPLRLAQPSPGKFTCFERDWLRTDLNVIGFGLIGWIAPSSIPAINGNSLTGLFFSSIAAELAHFPTGPALTSQFWLWCFCWHFGLFVTLTFGQIGFKGRADGYF